MGDDDPSHAFLGTILGRNFPVEQGLAGTFTLPVIHAELPGLDRRAVDVGLKGRSDIAYYAQLSIGTPPQKVFAQLDTGSFELWVNPNCSGLADADERFCRRIGRYDPANSSTSAVSGLGKSLRYGIGAANITYVLDDISLAGSTVMKGVRFGIARNSEAQFAGILGVGYGKGRNIGYNNFLDELATQSVIDKKAFSVALGSKEEGEGTVVFGGVDTSKFSGALAPLPIIPASESPDGVARYWVKLDSISHRGQDGKTTTLTNKSMPVFLDTGATLTLLPPDVANSVAAALNATSKVLKDSYTVDCSLTRRNGTVDFAFKGVTIKVPYKDLIRQTRGQSPICYLGITQSSNFALLGDTFLRSAFVVFDLASDMTYMAPYVNCGSSPQTIAPSSDLKNVLGACRREFRAEETLVNSEKPGVKSSTGRVDRSAAAARPDARMAWLMGISAGLAASLAGVIL
ncbi:hypothetical protein RJ55_07563 [Drechmeria coniospora]|nr:hypothetical protein RJ55_07563 [Drechmeria coniospora]